MIQQQWQLDELRKVCKHTLDQKTRYGSRIKFFYQLLHQENIHQTEMIETYQNAANGGRIGFSEGTNLRNKMSVLMNKMANGTITPKEIIELRNMESASMFSTAKGYGRRWNHGPWWYGKRLQS